MNLWFNGILLIFLTISPLLAFGGGVKFDRRMIQLGSVKMVVEVADTDERRSEGLMHRRSLAKNEGMLFLFSKEQVLSFWMKNTFIPLSIAFFDKNKTLTEIVDMEPAKSVLEREIPQYRSSRPALYALEANRGWFKENKLSVGATWKWTDESESKSQTKVRSE
ncbi:MAG: DUF192 domain-containing protein [Bdellovibrionales bacterium]|nr:DUF192 domain-containing protein [Bdellovibrionales bacterium]